jgi:hypothetical protein
MWKFFVLAAVILCAKVFVRPSSDVQILVGGLDSSFMLLMSHDVYRYVPCQ